LDFFVFGYILLVLTIEVRINVKIICMHLVPHIIDSSKIQISEGERVEMKIKEKFKRALSLIVAVHLMLVFVPVGSVMATAPTAPIRLTPITASVFSTVSSIAFSWSPADDSDPTHTVTTYNIQVATDNLFTSPVAAYSATGLTSPNYSATVTVEDDYWWRVQGVDNADNLGSLVPATLWLITHP
jgi:hypothetical protein